MITELKRLCEELEVDTQMNVTPTGDHANGPDAANSEGGRSEALPRYVETEIDDDVIDRLDGWVGDDTLRNIDEEHVLAELDEILLLLIAVRGEAIGKELSQDLKHVFGTTLSPGTVYPRLADLEEQGLLRLMDLPRRKVYSISDEQEVYDRLEAEMDRLVVFSATLRSLLLELAEPDQTTRDTS